MIHKRNRKRIGISLAVLAIILMFKTCLTNDPIDNALDKYEELIEETDRIARSVSDGNMTMEEFSQEYQNFLAKFDIEEMDVLDDIGNFSSSQLKRYLELEERFTEIEKKYTSGRKK